MHTLTGSYLYSHTDVAIGGRGPTSAFVRSYSSSESQPGPMGPGWTHSYNVHLLDPGDGSGAAVLVGPQGRTDRYALSNGSYVPPAGVATGLVHNQDGTYTATHSDQSTWTFNAAGQLTASADRYGNKSVLTYNANGQLVSISDPAGRGSLTLAYDATTGLLTSITDWAGRTVSYAYDTNSPPRLKSVTDRNNQTTTFAYDGTSQRLVSITDADGHVAVTNTYDAQGRVATQKDARGLSTGQQTTFSYGTPNAQGNLTTTVTYPATSFDGFAPQQIDIYNAQGQVTTHTLKPSASETLTESYAYNAQGFRTQTTDPKGNATVYCYDTSYAGTAVPGSLGNLTRVIAPAPAAGGNPVVSLGRYDAKNNLVQTVAPKGVTASAGTTCATDLSAAVNTLYATDLTYDTTLGTELLSVTRHYTDPDLGQRTATTRFEYGDAANPGLVTRVTPPRGNTGATPDTTFSTTLAYFGPGAQAGLLQQVTDPLGNATTYAYDAVYQRYSDTTTNRK